MLISKIDHQLVIDTATWTSNLQRGDGLQNYQFSCTNGLSTDSKSMQLYQFHVSFFSLDAIVLLGITWRISRVFLSSPVTSSKCTGTCVRCTKKFRLSIDCAIFLSFFFRQECRASRILSMIMFSILPLRNMVSITSIVWRQIVSDSTKICLQKQTIPLN